MNGEGDPWLTRPRTVRGLKIAGAAALVLVTLADLAIEKKPYFEVEHLFGFGAWYGLGAALALAVVAKLLGALLRREEGYYDD